MKIENESQLCDRILKDAVVWFRDKNMPIGLNILSARYGRVANRLKVSLADLVYADTRFRVKESLKGKRLIVPLSELERVFVGDFAREREYWRQFDVPE